jgi:hypothetical protein
MKIPITPSLYTDKISIDMKDSHNQEKTKEEGKGKQRPHHGDETLARGAF